MNTPIREKWGMALNAGFQVVPNVLIRAQHELGLGAMDVLVLLNLNLHWWRSDRPPFTRPAVIANRMGVSKRTVERRLSFLERKGFIERLPPVILDGGGPTQRPYRLDGLVERLKQAAAVDAARRQFKAARDKVEN